MLRQHSTRLLLACALGVALSTLSACSIFKGDEDPNPPAKLERFKASIKVKKAWSSGVGDGTELLHLSLGPSVNGNMVVAAAHDGKVVAFNAENGKRLWRTKTDLPLSGGTAVNDGLVAVGSNSGFVVALSAENGKELWRAPMSGEVLAAPAIGGGQVLVRTVDGKLSALSATDGKLLWFVQQSVPRLTLRGTSGPVINGQAVVCGFDNGRLAAYDMASGDEFWNVMLAPPSGRTEIERLIDINSLPVIVGRDIFAVSYQGRLAGIALEGGQLLWSVDVSSYNGIAADYTSVYATATNSEISAHSNGSGRELWRNTQLLNRDVTSPVLQKKSLVVGDFQGYLHWIDPLTGQLQARAKTGGDPIAGDPVVANDRLFVMTEDGKLVSYRIVDSKRK